jgi:hypothetical protein
VAYFSKSVDTNLLSTELGDTLYNDLRDITTFGLLLGSLFGLGLAMMLVKILTGVGMVLALRRAR